MYFPPKEETKPSLEFKINWTFDGTLKRNAENDHADLLFVLKESNINNDIVNRNYKTHGFWLAEAETETKAKAKVKVKEYMKKSIPRRLFKATKKLFKDDSLTKSNWYENVAYMNINKRGGYDSTENERLLSYCKKYCCFISREIQIINPKIIVFCGIEEEIIKKIVNLSGSLKPKVYTTEHPSHGKYITQTGEKASLTDQAFLKLKEYN